MPASGGVCSYPPPSNRPWHFDDPALGIGFSHLVLPGSVEFSSIWVLPKVRYYSGERKWQKYTKAAACAKTHTPSIQRTLRLANSNFIQLKQWQCYSTELTNTTLGCRLKAPADAPSGCSTRNKFFGGLVKQYHHLPPSRPCVTVFRWPARGDL